MCSGDKFKVTVVEDPCNQRETVVFVSSFMPIKEEIE